MSEVIDLRRRRAARSAERAFRNWKKKFNEDFGADTRLCDISTSTLAFLARGENEAVFYFYDLIMNIRGVGSGFQFDTLGAEEKIRVTERYFFLIDQVRYECMRRIGWLQRCPSEGFTLVELIENYDSAAPAIQADIPVLSASHPRYEEFAGLIAMEKESLIRGLIPAALEELDRYSSTL